MLNFPTFWMDISTVFEGDIRSIGRGKMNALKMNGQTSFIFTARGHIMVWIHHASTKSGEPFRPMNARSMSFYWGCYLIYFLILASRL